MWKKNRKEKRIIQKLIGKNEERERSAGENLSRQVKKNKEGRKRKEREI